MRKNYLIYAGLTITLVLFGVTMFHFIDQYSKQKDDISKNKNSKKTSSKANINKKKKKNWQKRYDRYARVGSGYGLRCKNNTFVLRPAQSSSDLTGIVIFYSKNNNVINRTIPDNKIDKKYEVEINENKCKDIDRIEVNIFNNNSGSSHSFTYDLKQ